MKCVHINTNTEQATVFPKANPQPSHISHTNPPDTRGIFRWAWASLLPSTCSSGIITETLTVEFFTTGWSAWIRRWPTASLLASLLLFPTFSHHFNAFLPVRYLHGCSVCSISVAISHTACAARSAVTPWTCEPSSRIHSQKPCRNEGSECSVSTR